MGGADTEIEPHHHGGAPRDGLVPPHRHRQDLAPAGLRSEASARFEKGTDPEVIELAHRRFAELLAADRRPAGGGRSTCRASPPIARCRADRRVNGILGTELAAEITALIDPIGFATRRGGDGELEVTIPTWRYDSPPRST